MDSYQIKQGGSASNERAKRIRALFEAYYDNSIAVISLDQKGDYGRTVHVKAKADLTDMNKKTLHFYSFSAETNKFVLMNPQPRFWIDVEHYLHFETFHAGDIVITDRPLKRK